MGVKWGAALVLATLVFITGTADAAVKQKKSYNPKAPNSPPFPPPEPYVTLPVVATFTLPDLNCSQLVQQPLTLGSRFRFLVSNETSRAWSYLYPTAQIEPGNVNTQFFAFTCAKLFVPPGRGPSTITVHAFCYLPDGVTRQQAAIASGSFIEAATAAYASSPLVSEFGVTKVQVTTHPSFSLVFCTGTPYGPPLCSGGTRANITLWNIQWLPTAGRRN